MAGGIGEAAVEVKGLKEVMESVRKLDTDIQLRILRSAERRLIAQIFADAKKILSEHVVTGDLLKGLYRSVRKKKGIIRAIVGNRAPHAALLEYGHRKRGKKKGGPSTEMVPALNNNKGFLRGPFEARQAEILDSVATEIKNAIAKISK